MGRQTGDFNRFGPIGAKTDDEPVAETVATEEAPASEDSETVDADGDADLDLDNDGHDDQTGEFVEGNQEAADAVEPEITETNPEEGSTEEE